METTERFNMVLPKDLVRGLTVTLIGCGATGGYIGTGMAKMGFRHWELWDTDKVNTENIGVQVFSMLDLHRYKVSALSDMIHLSLGEPGQVNPIRRRFTGRYTYTWGRVHLNRNIVITAVDNMETRRVAYNLWKRTSRLNSIFIDPRMNVHACEVYAVMNYRDSRQTPYATNQYRKSLNIEAPQQNCGAEAAPYTAVTCAALVMDTVKRWIRNDPVYSWRFFDADSSRITNGDVLDGVERRPKRRKLIKVAS